jgi:hypothetical protein
MPSGFSIYDGLVPDAIFGSSQLASQAYSGFLYWRGAMEFYVQSTGTPFHQGTLILAYTPGVQGSGYNQLNFSSLTAMQHVFLQANAATSGKITVPFMYPNDYYCLSDADTPFNPVMGSLSLTVFNPLVGTTTAMDNVTVSVFARLINSEFKVPNPPFNWPSSSFLAESMGFGRIVQKMLPKNIIADTIDTIAGFFGLDKPTSIENNPPSKILAQGYLNSSVAIEYNDKFSLFPASMSLSEPTDFATTISEMDFSVLKKKYTYFGSFNQNIADLPGTSLATFPISPTPSILPGANGEVPLLQYISMPFQQWRGGLTYKIQVVATCMHVAKIFVSVNYGFYNKPPNTPSAPADFTAQYGAAFEINQGSDEFEFTVPYVAATHSKYVANTNVCDEESSIGTISIFVVNRLSSVGSVANVISYNVFIAGADDYTVSSIASGNGTIVANAEGGVIDYPIFASSFSAESSVLVQPNDTEHPGSTPNVVSPIQEQIARSRAEPPITSLAEPLKKFQHVFSVRLKNFPSLNEANGTPNVYETVPIFNLLSGFVTQPHLIAYFSSMYCAFRGPLRFKLFLRDADQSVSMQVYYNPPSSAGVAVSSSNIADYAYYWDVASDGIRYTPVSITADVPSWCTRMRNHVGVASGPQRSVEIEIPFTRVNNCAWFPDSRGISDDLSDLGSLTMLVGRPSFTGATGPVFPVIDIYMAFGDESRFAVLNAVPRIRLNTIRVGSQSAPPDNWTRTVANSVNTLTQPSFPTPP